MQLNKSEKFGARRLVVVSRVLAICAMGVVVASCSDTTEPEPPKPTYSSVTTADFMSCDLENGGIAWCWGELGNGASSTEALTPVKVNTTLRFTELSAYSSHVCGLTAGADAYCWGPNTDGYLGIGTFDAGVLVPTKVIGGVKFQSISTGDVHTCGVSTAGIGFCWGDNVYGQGGRSAAADVATPTAVQGGFTWAAISAGTVNTCGITTTGAGYCWGSDTYGNLGNGGAISGSGADISSTPVAIAGGHTWKQISVGQFHACGLTTAGAAYCWGYNEYRLGMGGVITVNQSSPVAVVGGQTYKSIDTGRYTTCAITTADQAYCWGANLAGQFGVEAPGDLSRVPVLAIGGMTVSEINTSSLEHTCAVSLDRQTVRCFGRNDYAQLGNGAKVASTVHNWQPTVVTGQQP